MRIVLIVSSLLMMGVDSAAMALFAHPPIAALTAATCAVTATAIALSLRLHRPKHLSSWGTWLATLVLGTAGQGVIAVTGRPGLASRVLIGAAVVASLVAVFQLVARRAPALSLSVLVDFGIVAGAGSTILWSTFEHIAGGDRTAGIWNVLGGGDLTLSVLAMSLYMASAKENRVPSFWLAQGTLVCSIAAGFSRLAMTDDRAANLLYLLAIGFLAIAAVVPSMVTMTERLDAPAPRARPATVGLLFAMALGTSPVAAVTEVARSGRLDVAWITGSSLLLVLVGVRVLLVFNSHQRAEQELAQRAHEQSVVAGLGRRALDGAGPLELMDTAAATIANVMQSDIVAVFELLDHGDGLLLRTVVGVPDVKEEIIVGQDEDCDVRAALRVDAPTSPPPSFFAGHGVRRSVCVPIPGRDRNFGVIGAFFTGDRALDRTEEHFLSSVANVLGAAMARRASEYELQQAQKLESVGRLAAGIAHEINTPVQFVGDNLHFLQDAIGEFRKLVEDQRSELGTSDDRTMEARLDDLFERHNIAYLLDEMPEATTQALDGVNRVATIVRAMKAFGHPDGQEQTLADINQSILNTVTVARNEIKYVADVQTRFGEIPPVKCRIGELNQVFLNLIVNGAHAIEDVVSKNGGRGKISIRTWCDKKDVYIAIGDTGSGIPDTIRKQVFEPFFTTKEVGKGTGQGLALARNVVMAHGGKISFDSDETGTVFCIRLPIEGIADGRSPEHEGAKVAV